MHNFHWFLLLFVDNYNQTGLYLHYISIHYCFKYRDTVSYFHIFGSDTQYYFLVVLHIPSSIRSIQNLTVSRSPQYSQTLENWHQQVFHHIYQWQFSSFYPHYHCNSTTDQVHDNTRKTKKLYWQCYMYLN